MYAESPAPGSERAWGRLLNGAGDAETAPWIFLEWKWFRRYHRDMAHESAMRRKAIRRALSNSLVARSLDQEVLIGKEGIS